MIIYLSEILYHHCLHLVFSFSGCVPLSILSLHHPQRFSCRFVPLAIHLTGYLNVGNENL